MPEDVFDLVMPNVTINHTCELYGDNTLCDCDMTNLESFPTLEFKIG